MKYNVSFLLFLSIISVSRLSEAPQYENVFHFVDTFDDDDETLKSWHHSTYEVKSDDDDVSSLLYEGVFKVGEEKENSTNNALIIDNPENFKNYGAFRMFDKPFYFDDTFIVQYELSFRDAHQCGGAYLKLLSKDSGISDSNENLNPETPYTIMFGPDVCDNNYKFHFIFRHKNPVTGEFEEKHMKQPAESEYKHIFTDGKVHLLRLITYKWGQRFVIELDNYVISRGSLLKEFVPSVNPDEFIEDVTDIKPSDWDDQMHILDPNDTKPDDWDESEPEYIKDPDAIIPDDWNEDEPQHIDDKAATKPAAWNDDIDGDWVPPKVANPRCVNNNCGKWVPPSIKNPKYKGIFKPRMIKNPNYQGEFKPRKIKNPDFYHDKNPFEMTPIEAVAIEVVASPNVITFDNIIITNKADALMVFNNKNWKHKNAFNMKAFLEKYKWPIIIGAFIVSSIFFVIIIVLKYSSTEVKTLKVSSSPERLLESVDNSAHDENPDENSRSEEEHEINEEPHQVLRRSTRRTKKNTA